MLDSSLLLMPLMGFVSPFDPMWIDTLEAMDKKLVSDSLVYRYDPAASPDGLRGSEGTFSLCTFWYVDALARSGRLEEASLVFQKMHTYANHLGLYSEEIGLTGEQLGNFPQAFSHLSLINAAINLDYQLDHGAGNLGAAAGPGPPDAWRAATLTRVPPGWAGRSPGLSRNGPPGGPDSHPWRVREGGLSRPIMGEREAVPAGG